MRNSRLARDVSQWGLVALLINLFIGAGIFGLPARAFALADVYSLLALVVCSVLIALVMLCFIEVGGRFPGTGGPYTHASEAFGPLVGFQVGWLLWLTRITTFAILADILLTYVDLLWPGANAGATRVVLVTAIAVGLAYVNWRGVRAASRLSTVLAIAKLAPLFLFVVIGAFYIEPQRLSFGAPPSMDGFAAAVMALVFAFAGFEVATINTGEVRDPGRTFPRALFIALTIVLIFYLAIVAVTIGTLPGLADSTRPLADAAALFVGPLGATVIVGGAVISIIGTLNAGLLGGSRVPFAMAEAGQAPRVFQDTHPRYFTPGVAVWTTAAFSWLACLNFGLIEALAINTIFRLMTYVIVCGAVPRLRVLERRGTAAPSSVGLGRLGLVATVAALGLCLWLLTRIRVEEVLQIGAALALGMVFYGVMLAARKSRAG